MTDYDEKSCREKHNDLFHTIKKIVELETKSLNTRIDGIDRATVIQTNDLKDHLKLLNGHQAELRDFQNRFLTIERYDDQHKIIENWMEIAKHDLYKLSSDHEKRFTNQNRISLFAIIISTITAVTAIVMHFVK